MSGPSSTRSSPPSMRRLPKNCGSTPRQTVRRSSTYLSGRSSRPPASTGSTRTSWRRCSRSWWRIRTRQVLGPRLPITRGTPCPGLTAENADLRNAPKSSPPPSHGPSRRRRARRSRHARLGAWFSTEPVVTVRRWCVAHPWSGTVDAVMTTSATNPPAGLPTPGLGAPPADPDQLYAAFGEWVAGQGIELYPAQEEAVLELVTGSNVILATPTGSGKSLVAVAAHW